MHRIIEPEWLDVLPPDDPDAVRSRRDLCRVNAWMRHHDLMAGALQRRLNGRSPEQIVELGAGDGSFLLRVAQRLAELGVPPSGGKGSGCHPDRLKPGHQAAPRAILLDRQNLVSSRTLAGFDSLGWRVETIVADVFEWSPAGGPADVVLANLFLHHFSDARLAALLRGIAARARLFIAAEPRRGALPWLGSRLLWAIGCNYVTQHDARLSVRAGFAGDELSRLWPPDDGWQLTEQPAGAFSHLFVAQKIRLAT